MCSFHTDDLSTLYRVALSSRLFSTVALPMLYSSLTKFPSDDDEDRLAQDANRLSKWSSLWKSLAVSAQSPKSTTINYASCLRVLNLRDLFSLMEELRTPRAQSVRAKFFAGGLEECNKVRSHSGGPAAIFDFNSATDALTDIIVPGTRNVTHLIRQPADTPKGERRLHRWLMNMPALKYLQLFSGDAFGDERVHDAIRLCPNLKSIEIFMWRETNADAMFAQLLSAISGSALERFVIQHGYECFGQLSLSALSHYHGSTLTEFEVLDISGACMDSFNLATDIINLRSCTLNQSHPGELIGTTDRLDAISQFIARNKHLERLDVSLFGLEYILPSAIPSLRLKYLSIAEVLERQDPTTFWTALATQSQTLETLMLKSQNRYTDLMLSSGDMIAAIRQMYRLKCLTINTFGLVDSDVKQLVSGCQDLEDLSLTSSALTNKSLESLSTLPKLVSFTSG